MPVLLCFGDSNTHGTPPMRMQGEYRRFDAAARWPVLAAKALAWDLVEEGLPGRTAQFADPVMGGHMDGREGLKIALQSHGPIDFLTIMLGTNDAKARYGASAELITGGIAALLDIAQSTEMQDRHGGFRILLICPPPVLEQGPIMDQFYGARARGLALPPLLADLARARRCGFLDAGTLIKVSPQDGVHFEAESHATLAQGVAQALADLASG
ncbi:GDSL-type esterase/lipase family protein [Fuscibacter oryzae]|uniref:Lipolytic enzyme, G-D-S-L n=1 Tax=Fuscibacter oryzae TaxID=2803939 RepID=A0A8J7MTP5_9RHOB|nr:GDSL-type esterase/lipase family protein [Fuscibacter oryzae]MBL4928208.1 lipolytic enzyme, G-D-S-L [Fuscibacter oryzae]